MQAVILASGRGARFTPLTDHLAKPLLPAANRPLLAHLLHTLSAAGITQIIVTTGHLASQIEQFLATTTPPSIHATAVRATHWQRGPAASLSSALPHLEKDTPFLLLPADLHLPPQSLQSLLQHEEDLALLYDPTPNLPTETPNHSSTSLLLGPSTHTVTRLLPQQEAPASALPCLPVLLATPRLLQSKEWNRNPPATVIEILQRLIAAGHHPIGLPLTKGPWFDVDTPKDLIQLNIHLLTTGWPPTLPPPKDHTYLPPGNTLTGPLHTPTFLLGPHTRLEGPLLLGPHIHIGSHVHITKSTIAPQTIIHNKCQITNTVTLPHTRILPSTNLHNQIAYADGKRIH